MNDPFWLRTFRLGQLIKNGRELVDRGAMAPGHLNSSCPHNGDDGLSIIGVVIATVIMLLALLPAAGLLESTISVAADNRHRVVAANLMTAEMEQLRALASANFTALETNYMGSQTASSPLIQGTQYTVTTNLAWSTSFIQGTCGSQFSNSTSAATANVQPVLEANVTVTWQNQRLATPVTLGETINPPTGAFSSSYGNVLVSILNAAGSGNQGVEVELDSVSPTTPTSYSYYSSNLTDSNGCVIFSNVQPGNYQVALGTGVVNGTSQNPGYVNRQNNAGPTDPITVTAGTTQGWQEYFDNGSILAVQGDTAPVVARLFGITVQNTNLTTPLNLYTLTSTSSNFGPVFPEVNGYQTWLGNCPDLVPNPAAQVLAATTPGPTPTTSISPAVATMAITTTPTTPPSTIYLYSYYYDSATNTNPSCGTPAVPVPVNWALNGAGTGYAATINVPYGYFSLSTSPSTPGPTVYDTNSTGSAVAVL